MSKMDDEAVLSAAGKWLAETNKEIREGHLSRDDLSEAEIFLYRATTKRWLTAKRIRANVSRTRAKVNP